MVAEGGQSLRIILATRKINAPPVFYIRTREKEERTCDLPIV